MRYILERKLYFAFWGIAAVVQIIWIFNSDGFYFIDDSCHYNYNVHFLSTVDYSIGFWHRLGRVLLFFPPAQFGLKSVQIFSSLLFFLTIYYSYKILKIKGLKNPEYIILLIAFQPLLFNISYTTLAELPAAFLFIVSYYFFLKGREYAAMLFSSAIFLFRTELFFISGIYFLIYFFRKRFTVLPLIIAGPAFWYIVTLLITNDATAFFDNMKLHNKLPRITEGVEWYHYIEKSLKIFGLVQMAAFMAGLIIIVNNKHVKDYIIPLLFAAGGIIINTILALKGFNISCSTGQLRYVAAAGPAIALVAVVAFDKIGFFENRNKNSKKNIFRIKTWFGLLIVFIMFITGPLSSPFHKKFEIEKFSEKVNELQKVKYPDYAVISAVHQIATAMNEPAVGKQFYKTISKFNIENSKKALIVWEKYLEQSVFGGEMVTLGYIDSLKGVKLLDSVNVFINHDYDTPLYKYFNGYDYRIDNVIQFLISEQNTHEHLAAKIYIKD